MHTTSKPVSSRAYDRVSNGRLLSPGIDLRSAGGRRFRFLVQSYAAELGGELTEPERALVRQAVALQMQAEAMQEAIVAGEKVDADLLIRVSSTSKRLLSIIAGKTGKRDEPAGGPSVEDLFAIQDEAEEAGAE
jgi:hypothetical protein